MGFLKFLGGLLEPDPSYVASRYGISRAIDAEQVIYCLIENPRAAQQPGDVWSILNWLYNRRSGDSGARHVLENFKKRYANKKNDPRIDLKSVQRYIDTKLQDI